MPARKTSSEASASKRTRRSGADVRTDLLGAALTEFATHGFDGASTLSIARRAGAHQPQINYHFESKEMLWHAAVDHLFAQLAASLEMGHLAIDGDVDALAIAFAERVRRFVRFAAEHPELNRIITHEATSRTDRLDWMTDRHVRPYAVLMRAMWGRLRDAGIAAPIDDHLIHHVLVGAASLVFVNAPEFELLHGESPTTEEWITTHADGVVAMLLPGLAGAASA